MANAARANAGLGIYANSGRDMPLNDTDVPVFNDSYEITGPIVLLFILKDRIFLFAIVVHRTWKTRTTRASAELYRFKLHHVKAIYAETLNPR
jgi:hypothetical protein